MKSTSMENLSLAWWQIAIIKVAGMVCLPVLIVGSELGKKYGLLQAAVVILVGNFSLFVLGLANCSMAVKNKFNTMENATHYFGEKGAKIFSLNIIISLLGWYAIQLNVISLSLEKLVGLLSQGSVTLPTYWYNIFLGICITTVALAGIKGLNRMATFCAPLLFATVAYSLYAVNQQGAPLNLPAFDLSFQGTSLVMATAITAIVDIPTYYRYARSLRDGRIGLFLCFVLALPLLELAGAYISAKIPGTNLVETLTGIGGAHWKLWITFFLVFAGWTITNSNLYSSSVALERLVWKDNLKARIFFLGIIGTILSCLDLASSFTRVLNSMGILISSMGAVIICNYAFNQIFKKDIAEYDSLHFKLNIVSWSVGVCMGFCKMFNIFSLVGVELIDAFLAASLCTLILLSQKSVIQKKGKKKYEIDYVG